jgi:hypothetical protein
MEILFAFVLKKQVYLLYLLGVMISAGIIKEKQYFNDLFNIIVGKIKSKRLIITLTSLVTGVLPIPGRVTVSAGVLSTLAPDDDTHEHRKSRSKFGIIDYLATHHYYLWSPLEKTIIVPMAALGLSYLEMLSYTAGLLAITVFYIGWYIFGKMSEDDIVLNVKPEPVKWERLIFGAMPLFLAIAVLVAGATHWMVFMTLTLYYIMYSGIFSLTKLNSFVNWKLIGVLALVIIASNVVKSNYSEIKTFLEASSVLDMNTLIGFISISAIAYGSSFLLGSSGKYAGIVALLAMIYGVEYLTWFIALEFSAYLISPTHKCTHIGRMYFGTSMKKYYAVVSLWTAIMIGYAALVTLP